MTDFVATAPRKRCLEVVWSSTSLLFCATLAAASVLKKLVMLQVTWNTSSWPCSKQTRTTQSEGLHNNNNSLVQITAAHLPLLQSRISNSSNGEKSGGACAKRRELGQRMGRGCGNIESRTWRAELFWRNRRVRSSCTGCLCSSASCLVVGLVQEETYQRFISSNSGHVAFDVYGACPPKCTFFSIGRSVCDVC